jgi:hypothetical protein
MAATNSAPTKMMAQRETVVPGELSLCALGVTAVDTPTVSKMNALAALSVPMLRRKHRSSGPASAAIVVSEIATS